MSPMLPPMLPTQAAFLPDVRTDETLGKLGRPREFEGLSARRVVVPFL